jgi:hypothetical protein
MALKGDRNVQMTDISFFMNEAGARGGIVCFSTIGSGAALDQSAALLTYAAASSGSKPAGLLLNDNVSVDTTRQSVNRHKNEMLVGSKVTLLVKGWVLTDQIASGITIAAGDKAYLAAGGRVTNVNTGDIASPLVGRFLSKKDEDGFAKVDINLP